MSGSGSGKRVAYVHYVGDRPAGVYDSLDELCASAHLSKRSAEWMCTPTARRRGKSYIMRVIEESEVK